MKKKKLVIIYLEDVNVADLEKVAVIVAKALYEAVPDTHFLFTNKRLETISLKEILPWLKRLVKEAEA